MRQLKNIAENIRPVFDDGTYPSDFLEEWDQMECLAKRSGRETFLVRRRSDGQKGVAKCFDRAVFPLPSGTGLLKGIRHPGLPRFFNSYQNEEMFCTVREYIDGEPLNEYAAERKMSLGEIVSLCGEVCGILEALHSHVPALIHRDIKPENIIIRPGGAPVLIDFDIARAYREDTGRDTVCFGTRGYAPPEQYGFGQTDARADIYALGVLLRFLVTRSTEDNPNVNVDKGIQRVIDTCTAFSPGDRYACVLDVKRALERARRRAVRPKFRRALLPAAAFIFLLGGFVLGRVAVPAPLPVFEEPLIERAVRLACGRERGLLTAEDLAGVREICIYGDTAYAGTEEYCLQQKDGRAEGPIRTLSDLRQLPGLEGVYIALQGDVDIGALEKLPSLTKVDLKHMRISSPVPLGRLHRLKSAVLFDVGLTEAGVFGECRFLEILDIGGNPIVSMKEAGTHPAVRFLSLKWTGMDSLDGIAESFPNVREVDLTAAWMGDISALGELKLLERVRVSAELTEKAEALFAGSPVQVITGESGGSPVTDGTE